ncbi:MAG: flagellar protein, partial [Hydrogenoanaerobacterium sp.]
MSEIFLNRFSAPIVTGNITAPVKTQQQAPKTEEGGQSFKDILQARLAQQSGVEFSKHAVSRVVERGIEVSESNMSRLNEGVRMAQEKGLNDTLILIDKTAFI